MAHAAMVAPMRATVYVQLTVVLNVSDHHSQRKESLVAFCRDTNTATRDGMFGPIQELH